MSESSPADTVPEIEELSPLFPAYTISTLIAVGGMGAVYRATQNSLEREVAIKILPRSKGENEEFRKLFEEEAKTMARFNNANLISVIDYGNVEGLPFIIMEYVNGSTLHAAVAGMPVEQKQTAELMAQICSGIAYAHNAGMLHRDIKPANILLDHSFSAKVADFGLATDTDDKKSEGSVWGTPGYAAPELAHGPKYASVKSDIYAMGGVLYFILTAKNPKKEGVDLSKCSPLFRPILEKSLVADVDQRYDSASEMVDDLKELLLHMETIVVAPAPRVVNPMLASGPISGPLSGQLIVPSGIITSNLNSPAVIPTSSAGVIGVGGALKHGGQISVSRKSSSIWPVLLVLFIITVVGYLVFSLIFTSEKNVQKQSAKPVDIAEIPVFIDDSSFENSVDKEGSMLEGWGMTSHSRFDTVSGVIGSDGERALRIMNGTYHYLTEIKARVGYTYVLEFLLAQEGYEGLLSNVHYEINLTLGRRKIPVSFQTQDRLPVSNAQEPMKRYELRFNAENAVPGTYEENLGIRIITRDKTVIIDDLKLRYFKTKK